MSKTPLTNIINNTNKSSSSKPNAVADLNSVLKRLLQSLTDGKEFQIELLQKSIVSDSSTKEVHQ
jgi:hypothetical protein